MSRIFSRVESGPAVYVRHSGCRHCVAGYSAHIVVSLNQLFGSINRPSSMKEMGDFRLTGRIEDMIRVKLFSRTKICMQCYIFGQDLRQAHPFSYIYIPVTEEKHQTEQF